ncbi:MAG TPA: hypothetical protein VHT34_09795, partial [Clostridia bacterium]|nr:hypothetical protein [Clostridia bacterium]
EYASISKKFKGLAAEYKRHAYVDNEKRTLYGPVKNKDFINKAINMIVSEKEHEKKILADIYEYLVKQYC